MVCTFYSCVGHSSCTNIPQDLDLLTPYSSDLRKGKDELKEKIMLAIFYLNLMFRHLPHENLFCVLMVHHVSLLLWPLGMLDVKGCEEVLPQGKDGKQVIPNHTVEISGLPRSRFLFRRKALSKQVRNF